MSLVQINWQPSTRELRHFGIAMIVGFGLIGSLVYFGVGPFSVPRPTAGLGCWLFGGVAGVLGLTGTAAAMPFYYLWMGIAFVLGNVISRVILVLIYFLLFTPMGLIGRLVGRDKLLLKKPAGDTYWVDVTYRTDPRSYPRQF